MEKRGLYIILAFLILLFGCSQYQDKAMVKDLTVEESGGNNHTVSFFVINEKQEACDGQVRIILNNDLYRIYDLDMLEPGEKKSFKTALNYENGKTVTNILTDCKKLTPEEANACNDKEGIERRICLLTFNNPKLQQCLTSNATYYQLFCVALIKQDPEICAYITSETRKTWCKAYIKRDANICANIKNEKDKNWCYADIGMNFKDKDICDKISDEKSKTSCTAVTTKNPELCLAGAETLKLSCITNIAETTGKKDLCSLLSGEQKKECTEQLR